MTDMNTHMAKMSSTLTSLQSAPDTPSHASGGHASSAHAPLPASIQAAPSPPVHPTLHADNGACAAPPHVSAKQVLSCQNGEYANLIEMLPNDPVPCDELLAVHNSDGTVSFQPKKCKKAIDNFDHWLSAWSVFKQVIVMAKPEHYRNLATYRQFIHKCEQKFHWHAISTYDRRFRSKLSKSKFFAYDTIDNMLYVSILDATAIRADAKHCYPVNL